MTWNTQNETIPYLQKGDAPQLVILSGVHGDEHHFIPVLKQLVQERASQLPSFLFIPEVSPSAVKSQTRLNNRNNDLNRVFWDVQNDPEVEANKQLLAMASNALCLSFHEDTEFVDKFYMYDSAVMNPEEWQLVSAKLKKLKVKLLNGLDITEKSKDEFLGNKFIDGYMAAPTRSGIKKGPFIDSWAMYHSYISRMFTIEVPIDHPKIKEILSIMLDMAVALINKV
jgi:hypothetical protein